MGDKNLSLCHLCKEPVWSFVCPDCLSQAIEAFLPSSFSGSFSDFHQELLHPFRGGRKNRCVGCRQQKAFSLCPYCYTTEVRHWLEKVNAPLAERFGDVFSFGFASFSPRLLFQPEEETPLSQDQGICDECGEYSEELACLEGEWVCRECGKGI